jgi:hypothetical protein
LSTVLDGGRVIGQPWGQLALARVEAQFAAYKLVNLRVNAAMMKGVPSMGKRRRRRCSVPSSPSNSPVNYSRCWTA